MTITDGAIMFIACVVSFTIGYIIGIVRVARQVTKKLDLMKESMEQIAEHSQKLQDIYSRLGEEEKKY